MITKLLTTSEMTQFEKMLRGDGLNGYVLRQAAILNIFEISDDAFKSTFQATDIPSKLEKSAYAKEVKR